MRHAMHGRGVTIAYISNNFIAFVVVVVVCIVSVCDARPRQTATCVALREHALALHINEVKIFAEHKRRTRDGRAGGFAEECACGRQCRLAAGARACPACVCVPKFKAQSDTVASESKYFAPLAQHCVCEKRRTRAEIITFICYLFAQHFWR